jgi:REP element-mobilizing transposase RayT
MARKLKHYSHGLAYEICTSVQFGLPFVIAPYMEFLLKGILAAAQSLFPVTICHMVVMANHIHLIIIVKDPADVPRFMDYFKTESAHVINRLMGTTGRSFWCEGYDDVPILSAKKFLERMVYLYLNPVKAKLCLRARNYKGIHTYGALINGDTTETWRKVSRSEIPELPEGELSRTFEAELLEKFSKARGLNYQLKIEPWAWLRIFPDSKDWKRKEVLSRFVRMLSDAEEELNLDETKIIPEVVQRAREIRTPYQSKRSGKKMLCFSDCAEQRKQFISYIKEKSTLARDAYQRRSRGDRTALPPPGFFLPGGMLLANVAFPAHLLL